MPFYRPKGFNSIERHARKTSKKATWFKKGGHESFIMVPSTPGSQLKRMIEEKLQGMRLKNKIKVIEKPGQKFIDVLKINNKKTNNNNKCKDQNCLIGGTEKGGNCKTNGIVYKIQCDDCGDKYIGETSRNGHSRSIEHVKDSQSTDQNIKEKSVLLRR